MTTRDAVDSIITYAMKSPFSFIDFEPRDVPGHESNIAHVLGRSKNQTDNLLRAVDLLEEQNHFSVTRDLVSEAGSGSKGEVLPAKYRVTVRPA